ncbi:MAG: chemotaxis protein CheW, partial [Pseudomonadota bacterium]
MNIILLETGGRLFGIDAGRVVQVVETSAVTDMPFMPDHVEGLVNVGGAVVVSVDLGRALGDGSRAGSRVGVVVRSALGTYVLKVGRVLMMVPVDDADIHPVADDIHGAGHGMVAGEFAWQERMVLLLDPDRFDLGQPPETAGGADALAVAGAMADPAAEAATAATADVLPWLLVEVSGERYALDVRGVTEVVEADSFLAIPKAPPEVIGYHSLRGGPLLVASLAGLLGLPACTTRHVVVVDGGTGPLGLGVGRVLGIRGFDTKAAEEVADTGGAVAGCLVDGDGTMTALLDLGRLLAGPVMERLGEFIPKGEAMHAAHADASGAIRRLLTFWLGDELCGIDLEAVVRVAEAQGATELPAEDGLRLSGITQIGNEVMPLVDLRERRGKTAGGGGAHVVARVEGGCCAL